MDRNLNITSDVKLLPAIGGATVPTMSSREIAELVASRHDKVKQSIERLAERGAIALPPLGEYLDSLGRKASEYRIGKRDSYVIVAQLSPEFTARLVDRWQELEAGQDQRLPTTAEAFANVFLMVAEQERKQAVIEVEQSEQAKRIATTERRLDQIETATDHFTCVGYVRWAKKTSIDLKDAADLGRRASKRCRELGIPISKIPDPRFGAVNQFPKAILDEVWDEKFGAAA